MTPALSLDAVSRLLHRRRVLDGVTLSLEPGECRALVGLNGSGKTTTLRVALGMLRPTGGSASVLGRRLPTPDRRVWRAGGPLVEVPFSYPELTARQNVLASSRLHLGDPARIPAVIDELTRELRFTEYLDVPVRRLSLGTRQKVGLAAAMAHDPALLILDEPTNGLDPLAVVGLRNLIGRATARGAAVLVTSHHFDELARIADRVDVLHRGRIVDSFEPDGSDLERRFFASILQADTADAA